MKNNNQALSIVKGYHKVTPVPKDILRFDLNRRVAIILHTFTSQQGEMDFDLDFLNALLQNISASIGCNKLVLEIDSGARYSSIDALCSYYNSIPKEDRLPPSRISFKNDDKLLCWEETEFWVFSGGDYPYSDSYTMSFYIDDKLCDIIEAACKISCKEYSVKIIDIIEGNPRNDK